MMNVDDESGKSIPHQSGATKNSEIQDKKKTRQNETQPGVTKKRYKIVAIHDVCM